MPFEISLAGKTALVTGAGPQNGRAISSALARAGAAVAVSDVRPEPANETVHKLRSEGATTAIAVPFDVTNLAAVQEGIRQVEVQLGKIDILVNNAGGPVGVGRLGLFKDSDPAAWHHWIDINLYGAMYCIRTVLPGMVARGFGRIIQISSGSGYRPPLDAQGRPIGVSLYGASKAGIEGLIRHVAIESAKTGVRANVLALGVIGSSGDPTGPMSHIPLCRAGKPSEVGAAVVWLCSDEMDFLTGQVIQLGGGGVLGR